MVAGGWSYLHLFAGLLCKVMQVCSVACGCITTCRRLELFGEEHNIRDGWVTVGRSLPTSNFRPDVYASHFKVGRTHTFFKENFSRKQQLNNRSHGSFFKGVAVCRAAQHEHSRTHPFQTHIQPFELRTGSFASRSRSLLN